MKLRILSILIIIAAVFPLFAEESLPARSEALPADSETEQVIREEEDPEQHGIDYEYDDIKLEEPHLDSIPEQPVKEGNWWKQLRKNNFDLADTTIRYPKFLGFCVKVYNWADRVFNSYDTTYVAGTGRRWKARLLSDLWLDSYLLKPYRETPIRMMSDPYINVGAYIHYMAVSIGYSIDPANIFTGKDSYHNKLEYSFNCARFNIEGHYWENSGGTYIRTFGKYKNGKLTKKKLDAVHMKFFDIYGYFFFNNRKFAWGAAYSYSKYQLKSAGSAVIGLSYSNNDIAIDFSQLPEELMPYLTLEPKKYKFHYKALNIISGYSYNWVLNRHLLFNVSCFPGIGAAHTYEDNIDKKKNLFAMSIRGLMSLTYNYKDFFICGVAKFNGCLYSSKSYTFFSSVENAQLSIGMRF